MEYKKKARAHARETRLFLNVLLRGKKRLHETQPIPMWNTLGQACDPLRPPKPFCKPRRGQAGSHPPASGWPAHSPDPHRPCRQSYGIHLPGWHRRWGKPHGTAPLLCSFNLKTHLLPTPAPQTSASANLTGFHQAWASVSQSWASVSDLWYQPLCPAETEEHLQSWGLDWSLRLVTKMPWKGK